MKYRLNRHEYESNEAYLFHLYNDLGYSDLEVCYNYKKDDAIMFSKWVRFDYLMTLNPKDVVKNTFDTKEEFLKKVTHRSILDIEVLYDFDEDEEGNQKVDKIKEYAFKCIKKLNKAGLFGEAFFSGSKSIHYSVIVPELRFLNKKQRQDFKLHCLRPLVNKDTYRGKTQVDFAADLQKKTNRTMIALEGAKHWKTGIKKEPIDEYN